MGKSEERKPIPLNCILNIDHEWEEFSNDCDGNINKYATYLCVCTICGKKDLISEHEDIFW